MVRKVDMTTWVGACGTVLSFTLFLPQLRRTWLNRHRPDQLEGISVIGQFMILANAAVWGVYALLAEAFWTGAPGLINAPLAICTIILLLRVRGNTPKRLGCEACAAGVAHWVFITEPPGFGSVMPCSPSARRSGVVIYSLDEARMLRCR